MRRIASCLRRPQRRASIRPFPAGCVMWPAKPQTVNSVMGKFSELEDFEKRFETMSIEELRRWKSYWTEHARHLQPKVRKQAMKRVHKIDKAISRLAIRPAQEK